MAEGTLQNCEDRVAQLFVRMNREGVGLCVWKSSDRWNDGIAGKTDFDVLVAEGKISRACELMVAEGWIPTCAESWRRFDGLHDFCTFVDGCGLHVHLHEKIVSGEKMVKSLRPPLTRFYFDHLKQPGAYPPFVEPELELVLFLVRTALKVSWIDILGALRRRSLRAVYRKYQREYDLLKAQCDLGRVAELLDDEALSLLPTQIILDACDDLASMGWRERLVLRRAVARWREVGMSGVWLHSILRGLKKRCEGVGKRLPFTGISMAICGPDGSGKTTTAKAIQKILGRHIRVSRFYMGGNMAQPGKLRRAVMNSLWLPYLALRKISKQVRWTSTVQRLEGAYRGLNLRLMWQEKRRKLDKAAAAVDAGEFVLFERYPLFYPYGDDMAKTVHAGRSRPEMPDLLIFIDVDPELILKRRLGEDQNVLFEKVQAFRRHREHLDASVEVLVLKGDAPLDANVTKILTKVDKLLSARALKMCSSGYLC